MIKLLLISTLIILVSCKSTSDSDPSDNQLDSKEETISKTDTIEIAEQGTEPAGFKCQHFEFSSPEEQADSLLIYKDNAQSKASNNRKYWERKFFCAFPNSFDGMEDIFGHSASFYFTENPSREYMDKRIFSDVIGFFSELQFVPDTPYYRKYINININGQWQADNIREAFGFPYRLLNDTKDVCSVLSQYSDQEIKSVFRFIFDGPHPDNEFNERLYQQLKPKVDKDNKRLGRLLTEAYEGLIAEEDGHGH